MQNENITNRRTKIIATLGPASNNAKTIRTMIENGVDMFRLNASHNAEPEHIKSLVKMVRKEAKKIGTHRYVGIFMDLQGPKIRVGKIKNNKVKLKEGQMFELTSTPCEGDEKRAYIGYQNFVQDVQVDDQIFIDDGKVRLVAVDKTAESVVCKVLRGGALSNNKGVNLPQTRMSTSPFTEKDQKDALTAISAKVDYIALSFVSEVEDVENFRQFLKDNNGESIRIISKIERQRAVDNLVPIIDASDALMVARGDLGVEIGVEKVPKIQKMMIRACNRRLRPVIVATQMLESMIESEVATRAEVSDIANAVYDHCDAVMLSGETAVGINPPNVIRTMSEICTASDSHLAIIKQEDNMFSGKYLFEHRTIATSFCKAADQIAEENNAAAIMAFTSSGNTPLIASKLNSLFPIIAPTDDEFLCQRMSIYRGVTPMLMPKPFKSIARWTDMIHIAAKEALRLGLIKKKDTVVVTAGIPIGKSNGINSIRIITV